MKVTFSALGSRRAAYWTLRKQAQFPLLHVRRVAANTPFHRHLGFRRAESIKAQCSHYTSHETLASALAEPTIYALSSAAGRAAIAVIRVSGTACLDIYRSLCPDKKDLKPRVAAVRTLYEPGNELTCDGVLDSSALLLYFPAPKTVTGEDILELHVHGGPAIVKAVLAAIAKCSNKRIGQIRYAEPGEFTRRAFLNNRLDLTQVEALGDTLSADTEQQRRLSVRGTTGRLAQRYEEWRQQLLYARGELEALIDFSEDQHFDESPSDLCASVGEQVKTLIRRLQVHSQNAVRGELLRHGLSIAFLGPPNAGKSSLLNRIVGREAAIVSHEAGTTRDVVEVSLDLGGYLCRLGDTAGLRQAKQVAMTSGQSQSTISQIELEGMRRAKQRAMESDVVIVVLSFEHTEHRTRVLLDSEVCSTAARLVQEKNNVMVVINKADLSHGEQDLQIAKCAVVQALPGLSNDRIHIVSCLDSGPSSPGRKDEGNIQAFLQGLIRQFARLTAAVTPSLPQHDACADPDPSVWEESLGATARHRALLEACIVHLEAFLLQVHMLENEPCLEKDAAEADPDIVLAAEHLRSAADCLAKITGKGEAGDVEEVLGVVFEKFCVGK